MKEDEMTADEVRPTTRIDIMISTTTVTNNAEQNEKLLRFVHYSHKQFPLEYVLYHIADAVAGLKHCDPGTQMSELIDRLILRGFKYIVSPSLFNMLNRDVQTIEVEVVQGVTSYSQSKLFTEVLITFADDEDFVVLSEDTLTEAYKNEAMQLLPAIRSRVLRSRQGHLEAAGMRE